MDDRVPAADAAHRQMADAELVTDVDRAPRFAELLGGLRVGVQGRLRVGLEKRGQPCVSAWSGC